MKKILFLGLLLTLFSCGSMGQNVMGQLERAAQLWNFHEKIIQEIKARSPYQNTVNGTKVVYAYNRSTTRSLQWLDTRLENRGGYVWIYSLCGDSKKLKAKLRKERHDTYSCKIKSRNRYDGQIDVFNLEIVIVPGNVFVYLKRGLARVEDYSMR